MDRTDEPGREEMRNLRMYLLFFLVFFIIMGVISALSFGTAMDPVSVDDVELDSALFKNLSWRNIGPANMVGRISDVEGVPGDPNIVYVGSASGGVWKTTTACGLYWRHSA